MRDGGGLRTTGFGSAAAVGCEPSLDDAASRTGNGVGAVVAVAGGTDAAADPKPVVRKPPPSRIVETPPETRERPPAPAQARPVEPKATDNSAECARIFQLISLGQADQAVMDRFRTLRCR